MPESRAAAGAAVVGNRLYVVGGVGPGGLARQAFVLDLVDAALEPASPAPSRASTWR